MGLSMSALRITTTLVALRCSSVLPDEKRTALLKWTPRRGTACHEPSRVAQRYSAQRRPGFSVRELPRLEKPGRRSIPEYRASALTRRGVLSGSGQLFKDYVSIAPHLP